MFYFRWSCLLQLYNFDGLCSFGWSRILWVVLVVIIYAFESFSLQHQLMVFYWRLSDSKTLQVSRTLPSILADLSNSVVSMAFSCVPISSFFIPFNNPLVTVPSAPITLGNVPLFFCSLASSRYVSLFPLPSILLISLLGQQSSKFGKFSVFCWLSVGLVV